MRLFEQREAALLGSNRGGGGGNTSPGGGSGVARRQLLEVEGSVLLHMDMAVKHDAELGQASGGERERERCSCLWEVGASKGLWLHLASAGCQSWGCKHLCWRLHALPA